MAVAVRSDQLQLLSGEDMSKSTALGRGVAAIGILGTLAASAVGVARADEMVKIGEAAPVTGPASSATITLRAGSSTSIRWKRLSILRRSQSPLSGQKNHYICLGSPNS